MNLPGRSRTVESLHRQPTPHTDWCARDHRCDLTVHRSAEIIADRVGGRAVITRVRAGAVEYAEVRARIPLHVTDTGARWQLATTLRMLRELLAAVVIRPGVLRAREPRRAVAGGREVTRR